MMIQNSPALVPLLLLAAAISIPVLAIKKTSVAYLVAAAASFCSVTISAYNMFHVWKSGPLTYHFGGWIPPIGIEYVLDSLSAFVALVVNVVAFIVLCHAGGLKGREIPGKSVPYYSLVLLFLCGANGIIMTGDLFNLYVFLEIFALAGYGLIGIGEKQAPVAAFRYLIMGTVGASFYLLGLGFLYIVTGSLNMADVRNILPLVQGNPAIAAALSLMVIGMGIKMAIFPLHGWLPDAYTYAPSTTSALIAPIGTKVAAYVIIRLLFFVFDVKFVSHTLPITDLIGWLAAIGILFGSVMAMAQNEMKRMLAYSSVAQIGYIGLGIGLANPLGYIGAVLHILNHAFMKGALFLVAANLRKNAGHSDISKLDASYRKKLPWSMAAFTLAALSMIGLPPTAGFFSKWYLALGAIDKGNWVFLGVILLSSLLNAVYFFRILEKVYLAPPPVQGPGEALSPKEKKGPIAEEEYSLMIPAVVLSFSLLLLGLWNANIVKGIIQRIIPLGM
ncbi:MAG: monovalent cation/H+ antiporter subunit D family protein [Proteobacteria bacterium]|nr:monovalent cation/H+ antiporter subunit D family protein [Pseudomonadota bacterium]MBU4120339.1 monovalent cation/H+ antiporter subunit D family protein [Pseudomonadota bacterium]